jgi:hypothetical protein
MVASQSLKPVSSKVDYQYKLSRQQCIQLGLVIANHNFIIDNDDRNAHLFGLLYHLLGFLPIASYVVLGKGDTFLRKILFRPMAIGSGGGSVNNHVLIGHVSPRLINNMG